MRIDVDRERCLGTGSCIVYAPATFAHDAETKAVVVDPVGDDPEMIRAAVAACPTGALRIVVETEGDG